MRPWLLLPADWAHALAPTLLRPYSFFLKKKTPEWSSFQWQGLTFKNRLGVAGGVDKNGDQLSSWSRLGAGFIEVGTITPQPQKANPKPNIQRDVATQTLWNYLGFPNEGAERIKAKVLQQKLKVKIPLFINIGKNRNTPLEKSLDDYSTLIRDFENIADAFVINLSSPNTVGLRDLLKIENLKPLLKSLRQMTHKPLLIKLSPDMTTDELQLTTTVATENNINGFILTNTTLSRPSATPWPSHGGLSGQFLSALSLQALRTVRTQLGSHKKNFLLISAGGVLTAQNVQERMAEGADLVQVYSALVFSGPGFFFKVAKEIQKEKSMEAS